MDLATILGIVVGLGLIVGSIMIDGSLGAFINGPGMLIVLGGTIAAILINQKFKYVLGAFSVAMNTFFDRGPRSRSCSRSSRSGLLGLGLD